MKKYGKKLMALALICVMIFGVMPISMRQVKAGTNLTLTTESYGRQDWSDRYLFTISGVSDQADQYWNNNVAFIDGVAVTDGIRWAPGGGEDLFLLVYRTHPNQ